MKRCPRCDFIYEDDQHLCDLDGGELVHESGALPPPDNATPRPEEAPRPEAPPARSRRRGFAVISVAGAISAAVLFLVYYALPERAAPRDINRPAAELTAGTQPTPKQALAPTPAPFVAPPPPAPPLTSGPKTTNRPTPIVRISPERAQPASPTRAQPPIPRAEEKKPLPAGASPKKESTLGSILKKTGRMLKKPFKL